MKRLGNIPIRELVNGSARIPTIPRDVTRVFIFAAQARLQKVDPFALQEGDGRKVGGEKPPPSLVLRRPVASAPLFWFWVMGRVQDACC